VDGRVRQSPKLVSGLRLLSRQCDNQHKIRDGHASGMKKLPKAITKPIGMIAMAQA
jgi:hypothetical protein